MSAKFVVAVAYVIEKDGTVLVLRRSPSKDHAPGEWETGSGRVEPGETPEQAVHREVREETGLQVEVMGPVDTFHFYRGASSEETIGITFWCRYAGGKFSMCEGAVEEGIAGTQAFLGDLYSAVSRSAEAGDSLKQAYDKAMAALQPRYGNWVIFEHCMPFDVSRAYDEAKGLDHPRIWTAERDIEMWSALEKAG